MSWIDVADQAALTAAGKLMVKVEGRQILLVQTDQGLFAIANRCPHEGYPLSEGSLAGCILTCNWHNWKFDLASGETLVGGDRLRHYSVRTEAGRVWLDVTEVPVAERQTAVLTGLMQALEDRDHQRLLREAARLDRLGTDPAVIITKSLTWAHERLEYGTTHAFAAAPDWLRIAHDPRLGADARLMAIGEILGHIADDGAGAAARFAFTPEVAPWQPEAFLAAIEAEDEATAVRILRGALALDDAPVDLAATLFAAALAHYADFGHALIYTSQALRLIDRLGRTAAEPLLLSLVRSLVLARREDLLPEFREYRRRLDAWWQSASNAPALDAEALRRTSAKQAMALVAGWAPIHPPAQIFATLVEAAAWQLLHADAPFIDSVDQKLSENIGWLDFTHGLTFAAAGLDAIGTDGSLWPAVLLQLACFIGRNSRYVDPDLASTAWLVVDRPAFFEDAIDAIVRHNHGRFIFSAHLPKTLFAAIELAQAIPGSAPTILAAANRFLQAPLYGRMPLRMAKQMLAFVGEE